MSSTVLLPDLGRGLADAVVLEWRVRVGDVVAVDQLVAEVETAKGVFELPCPCAGTVLELHVPVGSTVPTGYPIMSIAEVRRRP